MISAFGVDHRVEIEKGFREGMRMARAGRKAKVLRRSALALGDEKSANSMGRLATGSKRAAKSGGFTTRLGGVVAGVNKI